MTTTADVEGYDSKYAFSKTKTNRATKALGD